MHTPPCKSESWRALPCNTGLSPVLCDHRGGVRRRWAGREGEAQVGGDVRLRVAASLCPAVETGTTLQRNLKWIIDSRSRGRETNGKTMSAFQLRLPEPERWEQKQKQILDGFQRSSWAGLADKQSGKG